MNRAFLIGLLGLVFAGCDNKDQNIDSEGVGDSGGADSDNDGDPDSTDCAPEDPNISSYAAEICDGLDNDCDGDIDDDDSNLAGGTSSWYIDQDGDRYGSPDEEYEACEAPYANAVEVGGDCDDDDSTVNPGEAEVCDGVDNDCSGEADDNPVDGVALYEDADGDGYGNPDAGALRCEEGDGWADDDTDCDDVDAAVNPGAPEICFNDKDDNCDEGIDDTCPEDHCGDITADETWDATPYGHYVSCDIKVEGATSPILTIAAGTVVYFAEGVGLYVGHSDAGALVIAGESGSAVEFTSGLPITDPDEGLRPGIWSGLVLGPYTEVDDTEIDYLELSYGGGEHALSDYSEAAGLLVAGPSVSLTESSFDSNGGSGLVAADGAMIALNGGSCSDNEQHGIYADDSSGLNGGSHAVARVDFEGNGDYPISVLATYAGEIAGTNGFSGHSSDNAYIELRSATISSSMTVEALEYPYYVSGDVDVWGSSIPRLTLNGGVELLFGNEAGLTIGTSRGPGSLETDGSSTVIFSAYDDSNGWDGITVSTGADDVSLVNCEVSHGGDNGYGNIYIANGSSGVDVEISDCDIINGSEYGLYVGVDANPVVDGNTISDNGASGVLVADTSTGEGGLSSFSGNTVTGNDGYPIELPASALGALSGGTFSGNTDDYVYVTASTVESDATWSDLDVDYWVSGDVNIEGAYAPEVLIEAGATFLMEASTVLSIGDGLDGALSTDGTAANPVTFTSSDTAGGGSGSSGDWDGLKFGPDALPTSELNGLAVYYAGSSRTGAIEIERSSPVFSECHVAYSSYDGVYVTGGSSTPAEPEFSDCTVEDNDGSGFVFGSDAGPGDFSSNIVTGNGNYPVEIEAEYIGGLDTATDYTGNATDAIYVSSGTLSGVTVSWSNLGVPYVVDTDLDVKNSGSLTLKAGVELQFTSGHYLNVGYSSTGSFTASGTSAKPVLLTSAASSPSAGDWSGVYVGSKCSTISASYLEVEYGATNLRIECSKAMTISNGTFQDSTNYDLYCGSTARSITWSGTTSYSTQSGCF